MASPHVMASINWTPPDTDNNGIADAQDNCPNIPNADQLNNDDDSQGDICDANDNNGLTDAFELSINTSPFLTDMDSDTSVITPKLILMALRLTTPLLI
ncbi:MAG: hypothetical protein OEY87_09255 [Gammaproteobacteria bacterium]|nr:hypothetical protein [Gammaproteobacteria bacterium]